MVAVEDNDYVHRLSRHFVALCCRVRIPTQDGSFHEKYCAFSRFILSVQDQWFWITAGHIFEEIDSYIKAGYTLHSWSLDDSGALKVKRTWNIDAPPSPETIPIIFEDLEKWHYCDEESGADYGFIILGSYYRLLLEANGVAALDESCWQIGTPNGFVKYEMLGIPAELVQELPRAGYVSKTYVCLDVISTNEPKDQDSPNCLFRGKVPDITQSGLEGLTKINGMSGGPIFGYGHTLEGNIAIGS